MKSCAGYEESSERSFEMSGEESSRETSQEVSEYSETSESSSPGDVSGSAAMHLSRCLAERVNVGAGDVESVFLVGGRTRCPAVYLSPCPSSPPWTHSVLAGAAQHTCATAQRTQ
jgi:hypothetical protein